MEQAERNFYFKKEKSKHLLLNDKETFFFHSLVKRNNTRNYISCLCRDDGTIIRDQETIAKEFVAYYTNLFGNNKHAAPIKMDILQSGTKLEDHESLELIRLVSKEEIKVALFDIGNEKAPRPDGYTSTFFKKHWEGMDLILAVKEFFATG